MKIQIWILATLYLGSLFCQIHEIQNIGEVFKYVTSETLVLFDVDDTLVKTPYLLGREEWFHDRVASLQEEGLSLDEARAITHQEWHAFQHVSKMEVVEQRTVSVIHQLQKNHYVMALTARDPSLSYVTVEQLAAHGIHFKKTALLHDPCHLSFSPSWSIYRDGIVFTSGGNKGEALFALLDQIDFVPKEIVFVDDRIRGINEVEECALKRNIPFIGLRYGHLDQREQAYDRRIAKVQYAQFFNILSDEEAKMKVNSSQ